MEHFAFVLDLQVKVAINSFISGRCLFWGFFAICISTVEALCQHWCILRLRVELLVFFLKYCIISGVKWSLTQRLSAFPDVVSDLAPAENSSKCAQQQSHSCETTRELLL